MLFDFAEPPIEVGDVSAAVADVALAQPLHGHREALNLDVEECGRGIFSPGPGVFSPGPGACRGGSLAPELRHMPAVRAVAVLLRLVALEVAEEPWRRAVTASIVALARATVPGGAVRGSMTAVNTVVSSMSAMMTSRTSLSTVMGCVSGVRGSRTCWERSGMSSNACSCAGLAWHAV